MKYGIEVEQKTEQNMIAENKNQPAFPTVFVERGHEFTGAGLTKREYVAAMTMQSLLRGPYDSDLAMIRRSIFLADELLKELEKNNSRTV